MEVEPARAAGTSVYHGQTYYFCSSGCKAAFERDPARYTGHGPGREGGPHGTEPHGHHPSHR
ncbi:MAG: YHS domain-containing protein [Firmicutes bacterium]|nr:YHS domain-containing protein [Bacillota bacterium]